MNRFLRAVSLGVATALFLGCTSSSALDGYDPVEVAYLKAQAEQHGGELSEAGLIGTLEFRADCRTVKRYLNAVARGPVEAGDPALAAFRAVPERFRARGQVFMVDHMRSIVAASEQGDLQPAIEFLDLNCQNEPGSPGGIDGVTG